MTEKTNEKFDGRDREQDSSDGGREPRRSIEPKSAGPTCKPGQTKRLELSDLNIVIETAWIPAGVFTMGSPASEANRDDDEGPQHLVRISRGFWMMTTEVQQGQWEAVMGKESNPSYFKSGPTYPVENVSWFEAVEFANELTESVAKQNPGMNLRPYYELRNVQRDTEGRITSAEVTPIPGNRGYRLPTEAEWEYACRAGTTTAFHFGQTIGTDVANYDGNYVYGAGVKGEYRRKTTPTAFFGERGRNPWGLYDMHGNVWEWCWDWYDEEWYQPGKMQTNGANERVNPTGHDDATQWAELRPRCSGRVLRGGSRPGYPWYLRSAARAREWPSERLSGVGGFRLCLDSE